MKWYLRVITNYANFKGRARRKEYWMFLLFNVLVAFCLGFVVGVACKLIGAPKSVALLVSNLYTLSIIIPSIAVAVRRMHDHGISGWWVLAPFYNVVLLVQAGQPSANKYGPDPKGPIESDNFGNAA